MSKNITIQEGGVAKQLTVTKLKTNLVGGGTQLWVPEDSVEQTIKNITANGTYRASDDGYYGYSEVTVNVPGGAGGPPGGSGSSIVGKDGDGDDAIVTVDPETGELEEEKLPNHIYVVTPPTNPYGIYTDGQAVIPDGMLVKAYLKSSEEYGTVPNSEIALDPTTASYDASTDHTDYTIDDTSILAYPTDYNLPLSTEFSLSWDQDWIDAEITANAGVLLWINRSSFLFSKTPATQTMKQTIKETEKSSTYTATTQYGGTTRISNTPFYYRSAWSYPVDAISVSGQNNVVNFRGGGDAYNNYMRDIATILFDGIQTRGPGSHQTINVSWPRPGDGLVLETSFEILVAPPYSSGED